MMTIKVVSSYSYVLAKNERWATSDDIETLSGRLTAEFEALKSAGQRPNSVAFHMRNWWAFGKINGFDPNNQEFHVATKSVKAILKAVVVTDEVKVGTGHHDLKLESTTYELKAGECWATQHHVVLFWYQAMDLLKEQEKSGAGFVLEKFNTVGKVVYEKDSCTFTHKVTNPEELDYAFVLSKTVSDDLSLDDIAATTTEFGVDQQQITNLQGENLQLKSIINRIVPVTPKSSRKRKSSSTVVSLKSKDDAALAPIASIVASDNGKKGKMVMDQLSELLKKNRSILEKIDREEKKFPKNTADSGENPPKRVLQIYSKSPWIIDKTPAALDLVVSKKNNLDSLVRTVQRNHDERDSIQYDVDDQMKIDNTDEKERLEAAMEKWRQVDKDLMEHKKKCFNCGKTTHRKNDCPERYNQPFQSKSYNRLRELQDAYDDKPMAAAATDASGEPITNGGTPAKRPRAPRRQATVDQSRPLDQTFTPGAALSDTLLEALDMEECEVPPWIYKFREHGYPTGWLMHARIEQRKPLAMISDADDDAGFGDKIENVFKFDVNKLIEYPGFNAALPDEAIDDNPEDFNEDQNIEAMRDQLTKTNEAVDELFKKRFGDFDMESMAPRPVPQYESDPEAEAEREKKEEELNIIMNAEHREFAVVTPGDGATETDDPMTSSTTSLVSNKGLPSLNAWSKGIAPIERTLQTPDTIPTRGTFKKLRNLLKRNRKSKADAEST